MRIGIDARPLWQTGGVGRIVLNVVKELERLDRVNEYYLYSKTDFDLPFENSRWHKRLHQEKRLNPLERAFHTGVWKLIQRDQLDVFWETGHILPFGLPATLPIIISIYDLVWRLFPHTMRRRNYFD